VLGIADALTTKARHQSLHNSAHGAFKIRQHLPATNAARGGIDDSLTGVALVLLLVFAPFGLMRLSLG
jgi:hypothetical protein